MSSFQSMSNAKQLTKRAIIGGLQQQLQLLQQQMQQARLTGDHAWQARIQRKINQTVNQLMRC